MQMVRVDQWNSTNYTVHARTRESELIEMIFEKALFDLFHKLRMYYSFRARGATLKVKGGGAENTFFSVTL